MGKHAKHYEGRSYEDSAEVLLHRVTIRWWDIEGDVTDEDLLAEAEEHVREMITEGFHSGMLNHEGDGTNAHGWWEIQRGGN